MKNVFRLIVVSFLFLTLIGCQNNEHSSYFKEIEPPPAIQIAQGDFKIEGELGSFEYQLSTENIEQGVKIITLGLISPTEETLSTVSIEWSFPSVNVYSFWNSTINPDKVTYYRNYVTSRASSQAPIICFINNGDQNRLTFALSDALNKVEISTWLREEDAKFYCRTTLFNEKMPPIKKYTVQIRIDSRNIPYYKAISGVSNWWASLDNYHPSQVPDMARMPMYSTWYSFHQNLVVDEVINECKLGKKIGLEAVIVDDGWQTLDNKRGYRYTGDWKPDRIPDMKTFVDSIHSAGMGFLLWYSLPFIGEESGNFEKFKGKYLTYWESQGTWILDPRYPEVREHIINTYETALTDWNLDGFKLDFLGWFTAFDDTEMTAHDGRDYASVNIAADRLMTDIMSRLRAIKPDIMIEFRQPYIGPLMRKYGNMFRAADCPNMEVVNRCRTTDLRLLSGNTAVHSDMFVWHKDDIVESAALQILNILFSVPQLSVKLDSIPEEHFRMVKFWINYWKENREVLLDGEFIPLKPSELYPVIKAKTDTKLIVGLYSDHVVTIDYSIPIEIDIINAKQSEVVIIDLLNDLGKRHVMVFDCTGNIVEEKTITLKKGVQKFMVPRSGLISISAQ